MFRWAASEMLISVQTYIALTTVEGLRRGRTQAREIRKRFGLDASRAVLGHRSVEVTHDYAELDFDKAKSVAQAIG